MFRPNVCRRRPNYGTGTRQAMEHIQKKLRDHFKCKFNSPKDFLGLDVTIVEEGKLTLSMSTFTKRMTTTLNVQRWKGNIATPGRNNMKILKSDETTN